MEKIHLIHVPGPAMAAGSVDAARSEKLQRHYDVIEIPDGASYLNVAAGRRIRLSQTRPRSGEQTLVVEPVKSRNRMTLLVLGRSRDTTVKINGLPAPCAAIAAVGDQLTFADDLVYRVLLYQSPSIAAPSRGQVGKECLVCRLPLAEDSRIYTCLNGCTIHCESDDNKSGAEPLECARLVSECPACQAPITLKKGYTHVPGL